MSQQFYKGRTVNQLVWVMVDATDAFTPESACSAATTIKIYGKLRANDTVQFVSSGTGSLTNDIKHVGASVTGRYTIGLAKADLSDASAAWYDTYVIGLSCTGCAYQTLVVDGGIDASAISAYQSRLSDILSQVLLATSAASDAASAAAQANSRVLLGNSMISDVYSQLSDFRSDLHSFTSTTGVGLNASMMSDIRSAIAAGPAATVTASDISDIASAVHTLVVSILSDIFSAAVQTNSRVLLNKSTLSDIQSYLVAMSAVLSDVYSMTSNTNSAVVVSPTVSDIASAVAVELSDLFSDMKSVAAQTNSRVLLNKSAISDLQSQLLVVQSMASDAASAAVQANSRVLLNQSAASDIYSLLSDLHSDVTVISGVVSDIRSDITRGVNVRAINNATLTGDGDITPWGPA
jgi:hypothetical protein